MSSALLREAQLSAMDLIRNSGMAVTSDIGDLNSIHPSEKIKVGKRLAYWALNNTYDINSIVPSGPIIKTYQAAVTAFKTYGGWPFGAIAAAATVAAGMAQVSVIRSQTYSGRRFGGNVRGGTPYTVGEGGPETFVPNQDGKIISNPGTPGGYTWEDAIIDNSEMLSKIKQGSGKAAAIKALKKFRPDLYV